MTCNAETTELRRMSNTQRAVLQVAWDGFRQRDATLREYLNVRRLVFRRWDEEDPTGSGGTVGEALVFMIESEAIKAGLIKPEGTLAEVDWDAFLNFLRELLPIILEFIKMFMMFI